MPITGVLHRQNTLSQLVGTTGAWCSTIRKLSPRPFRVWRGGYWQVVGWVGGRHQRTALLLHIGYQSLVAAVLWCGVEAWHQTEAHKPTLLLLSHWSMFGVVLRRADRCGAPGHTLRVCAKCRSKHLTATNQLRSDGSVTRPASWDRFRPCGRASSAGFFIFTNTQRSVKHPSKSLADWLSRTLSVSQNKSALQACMRCCSTGMSLSQQLTNCKHALQLLLLHATPEINAYCAMGASCCRSTC